MDNTTIHLHSKIQVGEVDPRIFGGFLEHMGRAVYQAAKMMKRMDRSLELVVCGSCNIEIDSYLSWDREVLEYVANYADYISSHRYVGNPDNDTPDFLAVINSIDNQIEETAAV